MNNCIIFSLLIFIIIAITCTNCGIEKSIMSSEGPLDTTSNISVAPKTEHEAEETTNLTCLENIITESTTNQNVEESITSIFDYIDKNIDSVSCMSLSEYLSTDYISDLCINDINKYIINNILTQDYSYYNKESCKDFIEKHRLLNENLIWCSAKSSLISGYNNETYFHPDSMEIDSYKLDDGVEFYNLFLTFSTKNEYLAYFYDKYMSRNKSYFTIGQIPFIISGVSKELDTFYIHFCAINEDNFTRHDLDITLPVINQVKKINENYNINIVDILHVIWLSDNCLIKNVKILGVINIDTNTLYHVYYPFGIDSEHVSVFCKSIVRENYQKDIINILNNYHGYRCCDKAWNVAFDGNIVDICIGGVYFYEEQNQYFYSYSDDKIKDIVKKYLEEHSYGPY